MYTSPPTPVAVHHNAIWNFLLPKKTEMRLCVDQEKSNPKPPFKKKIQSSDQFLSAG